MAQSNSKRTATWLVWLPLGMLALSFLSVPLYQIFCKVTGFSGRGFLETAAVDASDLPPTTETGVEPTVYTISFDANVSRYLPWNFEGPDGFMKIEPGKLYKTAYQATNFSSQPVSGTATFSVTPHELVRYLSKIECFCFTETTLQPGESIELPLQFFLDADIVENENLKGFRSLTLSYYFNPLKE